MSVTDWVFDHMRFSSRRPPKPNYPKTVAEVLDNDISYRNSTLSAMRKFKKSKPWEGGKKGQQEKFRTLLTALSKSYKINEPQLVFVEQFYPSSCYFPMGNLIVLEEENDGRYSVIVFLHEFGHALGKDEEETCRWSINLFRKIFPKTFAKLKPHKHLLFREDSPVLEKIEAAKAKKKDPVEASEATMVDEGCPNE